MPTYNPDTGQMEQDALDYFFSPDSGGGATTQGSSTPSYSFSDVLSGIQSLFSGKSSLGPLGALLAAGGVGKLLGGLTGTGGSTTATAGYRGGIPQYTATMTQTPMAQQRPPGYQPGQGGITYFNPVQYTYTGQDLAAPTKAASGGYMPGGGIAGLAGGGRFLRGGGDGVSDSIPARFAESGKPARLADGEFVIDARTVSEIGNGSSEAGARKLYEMMDRVHRARRQAKRGEPSGADKYLPK